MTTHTSSGWTDASSVYEYCGEQNDEIDDTVNDDDDDNDFSNKDWSALHL
jgi:hypothetical protein